MWLETRRSKQERRCDDGLDCCGVQRCRARRARERAAACDHANAPDHALGAPRANVGARSALARDSAPLVNSPTPRGTVDRRVTVPETEGRLLSAFRLLSPHGTEMRA
jgi:hypothetical protein